MIRRFLIPLLIGYSLMVGFAPTDYQVILKSETHHYQVSLSGTITPITPPPSPTPLTPPELDLPFQPLFQPIFVETVNNLTIFSLSGETDSYTDLYGWTGAEWQRLTDIIRLFPEATLLSASVEWISPHLDGFLYRARGRNTTGQDHNALYFYNWENQTSEEMPFFGKNPVFSPNDEALVGSRLNAATLLYELWLVDLVTGEEEFLGLGCNPQWSPDGRWLAYDGHDNSQWQGYTDCFANGEVNALNMETGEQIHLSDELEDFVTLENWVGNEGNRLPH